MNRVSVLMLRDGSYRVSCGCMGMVFAKPSKPDEHYVIMGYALALADLAERVDILPGYLDDDGTQVVLPSCGR